MKTKEKTNLPVLVEINEEVTKQLASPEVMRALVATTFKGLTEVSVKQAITEGMMRGFQFKDFLEKNVYAVPFAGGYSLVTSIDYARKIGMRSGVVGRSTPTWEIDGERVISCTVTVKKKIDGYVGDFTETVYFEEYYSGIKTGRSKPTLWDSKPKTMLAKVAEMHALRMACPEELSQTYTEEEFTKEADKPVQNKLSEEDQIAYQEKLESAKDIPELQKFWADLPGEAKQVLNSVKDNVKAKFN